MDINDLSDDLTSNPKLFADDTSPFQLYTTKTLEQKKLKINYGKLVIVGSMENDPQPRSSQTSSGGNFFT